MRRLKRIEFTAILLATILVFVLLRPLGVFADVPACANYESPEARALCEERIFQRYGVQFLDKAKSSCKAPASSTSSAPSNKSLYLIGDSIGAGLSTPLKTTLSAKGWSVTADAEVGRPLKTGIPITASYMQKVGDAGAPGAVLVVLGTNNVNNGDNEAEIANMVKAVKGTSATTEVYWLAVNVTRSDLVQGAASFNKLLAANSDINVLNYPTTLVDEVHPKDYNSLANSIAQSLNGTENSTPSPSCTCGAVEVSGGSNNEETAFKFFVANQYTKEQSAGIVGNLIAESGVNPRIVQGGKESDTPGSNGYGIAQWTPGTKILDDAKAAGASPGDLSFQLKLLLDQLNGLTKIPEKAAGDALKQQSTVADAAKTFMLKYERPADKSAGRQNERARLAEGVFQRYASSVNGASSSSGSSCDGLGATDQIIDGFVVYSQTDERWKGSPYGTSTVGEAGCGPSAVAMVVSTWVDKTVTPDVVAKKYAGYYVEGAGSKHTLIPDALAGWNLKTAAIGKDMQAAKKALQQGSVVVAVGSGADPFTQKGHFIVLRGITKEGKILVGDSGHANTSQKEWDESIISAGVGSEGGEMWVVSK